MRLPWALVLGALLGAAQAQDSSGGGGGGGGSSPSPSPSTPPSTSNGGGGDTTVFTTQTVTGGGGSTVTSQTTLTTTVTTTVVVTSTAFATTTVTSRGQDTATQVVYVTTTVLVNQNQKRVYLPQLAPRTLSPAKVDAVPTGVPVANVEENDLQLRDLEKRATITEVVTVTVGGGSGTTIVNSVVKTILHTETSQTTITNTITSTDQADAKSTITSTSTLTVTSTVVTTGVVETVTGTQPGTPASTNSAGGSGSNDQSSGLSTGAKAGIGVGAGVGGLAIIGGLLWFAFRRRDKGPGLDHDDLIGASEVPVGGPGGRGSAPMSSTSAGAAGAAAFLAPGRNPSKPATMEGYRGTAMGDGRAGFAKPDAYGSAYTPSPATTMTNTVSPNPASPSSYDRPGAAELGNEGGNSARWHDPNASEIDGHAVMSHQSGPVYEMPSQNYR